MYGYIRRCRLALWSHTQFTQSFHVQFKVVQQEGALLVLYCPKIHSLSFKQPAHCFTSICVPPPAETAAVPTVRKRSNE